MELGAAVRAQRASQEGLLAAAGNHVDQSFRPSPTY